MTSSYIDKENGCPLIDPFQQILDKIEELRGELEVLKMMMHIKEISPSGEECPDLQPPKSRCELISELDYMILCVQSISDKAKHTPVTHADHLSLMMLISSLFKAS
jgi:hypothetical protein